MNLSLRTRLLIGFILAVGLTGLVSTVVGTWMMSRGVTEEAQLKSRHDLKSARLIYDYALEEVRQHVRSVAHDPAVRNALQENDIVSLPVTLEQLRREKSVDVLCVLDSRGVVRVRARNPSVIGDDWGSDPVVRRVLAGAGEVVSTAVVPESALVRESPELALRARIELLEGAEGRVVLSDGLVQEAASRIVLPESDAVWIVVGWRLLNRDVAIVDRIKQTLYGGEVYRGREVGEGTICLGDVRVATNAVVSGTQRAVGSLVAPAVRQRVLKDGVVRVNRADVLGETHLTAYEPIKNIEGEIVGMLCLGIPEERYAGTGRQATLVFLGISLGGILLSLVISGFTARSITGPIRRLVRATAALAEGSRMEGWATPSGIREIDELANRFGDMAAAIERRDQQLSETPDAGADWAK